MTKIENLSVDVISTTAGTQMRAKVNQDVVDAYAELWKAKHEFPPLDVFYDGTTYYLGDGFHRLDGAKDAKRASVPCRIQKGTLREAVLFACGANHDHGLYRSRADKRTAVTTLLDDDEWGKKSARWISEQCRVSHGFVLTIQAERKTTQSAQTSAASGNVTTQQESGNSSDEGDSEEETDSSTIARNAEDDKPEGPCHGGGEHELDDERICMKCHEHDPELHGRIDEQNKVVEAFAKSLLKAFDSPPSDPWLDESRLQIAKDQIKSACATIRLAKAYEKACPKCLGKGCKTCRNCGYLPKSSYEAAGGQ